VAWPDQARRQGTAAISLLRNSGHPSAPLPTEIFPLPEPEQAEEDALRWRYRHEDAAQAVIGLFRPNDAGRPESIQTSLEQLARSVEMTRRRYEKACCACSTTATSLPLWTCPGQSATGCSSFQWIGTPSPATTSPSATSDDQRLPAPRPSAAPVRPRGSSRTEPPVAPAGALAC
jgi:hypothetical protein